jgi:hypothetical protein
MIFALPALALAQTIEPCSRSPNKIPGIDLDELRCQIYIESQMFGTAQTQLANLQSKLTILTGDLAESNKALADSDSIQDELQDQIDP